MARCKVEEVNRWRVEMDVEAILDTLEDRRLVNIVVASVYYTNSFRPALLCRTNCCPKNSFTAAAGVTADTISILYVVTEVCLLPKRVEEAHNAIPLLVCLTAASFTTSSYRRDIFPIIVLSLSLLVFLGLSCDSGQQ